MATNKILSVDSNRAMYNDRTYVCTTYSSTGDPSFYPYLPTLPIPPINVCENLLYGTNIMEDVGSVTASSSYIHASEHYDNTCIHTYDNPMEYLETVSLLLAQMIILYKFIVYYFLLV